MLGAEVHGGGEAQVQMFRESEVGQHAYRETCIPFVIVAHDGLCLGGAVFLQNSLRTHILQFDILQVHTHKNTQVQWSQVGIRLVLHLSLLGHCHEDRQTEYEHQECSLHLFIIT